MAISSDGISPAEAEDLIEAFSLFDKDKDGKISLDELEMVMQAMGQSPSKEELEKIMKKIDKSEKGYLSEEDYVRLIKHYTIDENLLKTELREVFKKHDLKRKGSLTVQEMKSALENVGQPLQEKEIRELMIASDVNKDGHIDPDEFVNLVMKRL